LLFRSERSIRKSSSALKGRARASAQLKQQFGMLNEVDYKTNELIVRFMSKPTNRNWL
jgi:hypothetical protein